jgi:hypothetical protein
MSADSRLMELSLRAWGDPDIQWAVEEIKRLNYEIRQLTMRLADQRPAPTGEIVINQMGDMLDISLTSDAAAAWIDREAPIFTHAYSRSNGHAVAYVRSGYDPVAVAEYLRSYTSEGGVSGRDE